MIELQKAKKEIMNHLDGMLYDEEVEKVVEKVKGPNHFIDSLDDVHI
jgi:hypothetical protein